MERSGVPGAGREARGFAGVCGLAFFFADLAARAASAGTGAYRGSIGCRHAGCVFEGVGVGCTSVGVVAIPFGLDGRRGGTVMVMVVGERGAFVFGPAAILTTGGGGTVKIVSVGGAGVVSVGGGGVVSVGGAGVVSADDGGTTAAAAPVAVVARIVVAVKSETASRGNRP